jgi:hypothetical protein
MHPCQSDAALSTLCGSQGVTVFRGMAKRDPRPARGAIGINLFIGIATVVALTVAVWCPSALAQQSTQDLATAAQNPIAATYSLPLQNNTYLEWARTTTKRRTC